jgi:cellulose synthase/poly-beta-1,6-N-acetylglucosamine synthase-like glycosyltransferase
MGQPQTRRGVAIAIPACNEATLIGRCVRSFADLVPDDRIVSLDVVVLANNCTDDTALEASRVMIPPGRRLHVLSERLPAEKAHAGWARRLAAAGFLRNPDDVLMCTDADTLVARDWVSRTLDHLDDGWDAVAGAARLNPRELRGLPAPHRARLAAIRRYENALTFLKARQKADEPWPRHFYEGGASIALTLKLYRRIGGAPAPPVSEDKALFDAVRRHGGRVRHPTDVKVVTSSRLHGRAPGGASDTLSLWGRQGEDEPIHELASIAASLGYADPACGAPTFRTLPAATRRARQMVHMARRAGQLALAS